MALHGIAACYSSRSRGFAGVTCTDGSGSPRAGKYSSFTDEEMRSTRRNEQNAAAVIGRYGLMIQLDHPSGAIRNPADPALEDDLLEILEATRPEIVYTHNLADRHDTHIGVAVAAIRAIRRMPRNDRPKTVWGCEVWRSLDWLSEEDTVAMDVSGHDRLAEELNAVFDSQIAGGKRYDLAIRGRRAANATFFDPNMTDRAEQLILGMDLTLLIVDELMDIRGFVDGLIERFRSDVATRLNKRLERS